MSANKSRTKYPWDQWFLRMKKRPLSLHQGSDFKCQAHGMAQQIRNVASSRGVTISIEIQEKTITVRLT